MAATLIAKGPDFIDRWRDFAERPDFAAAGKVHDWRNYINDELKSLWPFISLTIRCAIIANADDIAGREDWE